MNTRHTTWPVDAHNDDPYLGADCDEMQERAPERGSDRDAHLVQWAVAGTACLASFFLGSFFFSGLDVSGIERQLSQLQSTVQFVADKRYGAMPQNVRIKRPFLLFDEFPSASDEAEREFLKQDHKLVLNEGKS